MISGLKQVGSFKYHPALKATSMIDISLPAAALGGLVSFLSPCVLPLVPPYLSFMAGMTVKELSVQSPRDARRRIAIAACLFVAGFSTIFVLLGATASVLGRVVRDYLETLSLLAGIGIIVMGLHFLGLFRIAWLYREKRFHPEKPSGLGGAYFLGVAFAFGWTPCIGPVLAAILAVAGSEAETARGALLLAVYSLGLGIPFLLAALALDRFSALIAKIRRHFRLIETVMGILLVLTGIAFLSGSLTSASYWLLETFPALGGLG